MTVVVPRHSEDTDARRYARNHVLTHYAHHHPAWRRATPVCPLPEWSKGATVNSLLTGADADDVVLLADADSFTDPATLAAAVEAVESGQYPWAVPFTDVLRITRRDSERIMEGHLPRRLAVLSRTPAMPGGGIVVASRAAWATVNGVDPRFQGWGGEDVCLGWALRRLCGDPWRPPRAVSLKHLWHPGERRPSPGTNKLWIRYRRARYTPAGIAAIVKEW